MAKTTRQTAVFGVEDWRKIYQTYREADFQSYDFETLRKTFVDYLRQYYPENFNDYTESSEFVALLDVMAFMGQSVSYRTDLNARENFLDTAERRDSAVRLAQLIGYTPKRNTAASGYLKVQSISTTENVLDFNGVNLVNSVIRFNDPTNNDWQEQFTAILNAAFVDTQRVGRPADTKTLLGVATDEYTVQLQAGLLPVIPFQTTVNNTTMNFEIVSATTRGQNYVYEPSPRPNSAFNILYRNDGLGFNSNDTGWFLYFKQGTLQNQDFALSERVSNRVINLGLEGVNNNDIWLYQLDSNGNIEYEWQETENIYLENTNNNEATVARRIFSVTSRANDGVNFNFGDGIFSSIPVGVFRSYVRLSNGLTYTISPDDIQNVQVPVSYISRSGRTETLTFTVSLTDPVNNALARETLDDIKLRAPARYYTQNRMVNGEDYNNFPYTLYSSIIKSKAVNRTSLGISRYLDLTDPTGKYSSTNLYASDGLIYRDNILDTFTFSYDDVNDITDIVVNRVEPKLRGRPMQHFYYDKDNFPRLELEATGNLNVLWNYSTTLTNETTGYFYSTITDAEVWTNTTSWNAGVTVLVSSGVNQGYYQSKTAVPAGIAITNTGYWVNLNTTTGQRYQPVGQYADNNQKYVTVGSLVKFVAPSGQYFDRNNNLQNGSATLPDDKNFIWATITSVVLDGTNFNQGNLDDGTGPVTISRFIPTGAVADRVIPLFVSDLPASIEKTMIEQVQLNRNFGIGYDYLNAQWYVITSTNLSSSNTFSLTNAKSQAGTNQDASWLVKFTTDGEIYSVRSRSLNYYFSSVIETRFFFDGDRKIYDSRSGTVIDDFVNILKINNAPQSSSPLNNDIGVDIIDQPITSDGFVNDFVVTVSYTDNNSDGYADNPDFFDEVVNPDSTDVATRTVFFQEVQDFDNLVRDLALAEGTVNATYATLDDIELVKTRFVEGQVFYAYTDDKFYTLSIDANGARTLILDTTGEYSQKTGRGGLYFQYRHNSPNTRRIDPAFSNTIDIYVVTAGYYQDYLNYINDTTNTVAEPTQPNIDSLTTEYSKLQDYKMISDNIVLNSVKFKPLFGEKAETELQATIKVVPLPDAVVSSSEIKSSVLAQIDNYFDIDKWEFGQTFYFSELAGYLQQQLGDIISSVVLVPNDSTKSFGDLYELRSQPNEIFVNAAQVSDIEVVTSLNSVTLRSGTANASSTLTSSSDNTTTTSVSSVSSGSSGSGSGGY